MSGWRKRQVMEMALEALTYIYTETTADEDELIDQAITAIKEVLAKEKALQALHNENERLGLYKDAYAQPEQEPVGKFAKFTDGIWREVTDGSAGVPLYTTPPQRTWVGLTEEDLKLLSAEWRIVYGAWMDDFARDIEAKLKGQNT